MKVGAAGFSPHTPPAMVDRLLAPEQSVIEAAESRRDQVALEKNDYGVLGGLLGDLDDVASKMGTVSQFTKLKVDSSHPDILAGAPTGAAMPGTYEFEIRGLATRDRQLDAGFPDRDKTPVGFGHMEIEVGGVAKDVTVSPGSTLNDVVRQINDADAGVRAQIVNTGFPGDPLRLLVSSVETGEEARISFDEDTTFLNFQKLKQAAKLDARFEDVPVTGKDNALSELLDGIELKAKRAEPGTRVQIQVNHDVDATMKDIKTFTDKYNEIMGFAAQQYQKNETGDLGRLAGDGGLRTVMRRLQTEIGGTKIESNKFSSLAEIGVTTDHKTGQLRLDETKLKAAMEKDYDGVAKLFAHSENGKGVAGRLHEAIRSLRDPVNGVLTTRVKGLSTVIENQDRNIQRQKDRLEQKKESLTTQFANLETKLSALNAQNQMLVNRFQTETNEEGQ